MAAERDLLRERGHSVAEYIRRNDEFQQRRVSPGEVIWSRRTHSELTTLLRGFRPDIAHVHNIHALISPSAYYACHAQGVPVVQTLHNYRLVCPVALLYRQGHVCEECLGRSIPWPGVRYGCYRDSRLQTAGVAATLGVHNLLGTWRQRVDAYIALTEFAREKFVQGGLPAGKIAVKPNFFHPDPGEGLHSEPSALFVGRLVPEKGIPTLLKAWEMLGDMPLKIAGQGPLEAEVEGLAKSNPFVEWLGYQSRERVLELMKSAAVLIFPSEWYEGFPVTLAEAFACGLPVIAARIGAMAELIEDGLNGLHFTPGDPADLVRQVRWVREHSAERRTMGRNARRTYEEKFTADKNYEILIDIYRKAGENFRGAS